MRIVAPEHISYRRATTRRSLSGGPHAKPRRRGSIHADFARICGFALLAACLYSCRADQPEPPRLVVLYATCTVNKDYLSPYNEEVVFTPNLADFGREAAVFLSHQTESGVSGTAFASIYSGVQADRHGVFKHPQKLDDDLYLIFEAFADAGYDTFYWAGHPMSRPELNYSQDVDPENIVQGPLRGHDKRFHAVLDRLRSDEGYRALVVTSFSVTHGPWELDNIEEFRRQYPAENEAITQRRLKKYHRLFKENYVAFQTRFDETVERLELSEGEVTVLADVLDLVYKSRVHLLDTYFGGVRDVVDEYGFADDSLVVFTADHGETLDNDDRLFKWTHGPDLAPEVINVPLMIKGHQDLIPARQIDDVTRSIDVYPSLAGMSAIQLPPEAGIQGIDLSRPLRGEEEFPAIRAYSHGTLRQWSFFDPDLIENIWASVRVGDLLYTWKRLDSRWIFDVRDAGANSSMRRLSPNEPGHQEVARELWKYREHMIEAFRRRHPDEAQSKIEELGRLKDDELEALRKLGYIE